MFRVLRTDPRPGPRKLYAKVTPGLFTTRPQRTRFRFGEVIALLVVKRSARQPFLCADYMFPRQGPRPSSLLRI